MAFQFQNASAPWRVHSEDLSYKTSSFTNVTSSLFAACYEMLESLSVQNKVFSHLGLEWGMADPRVPLPFHLPSA